MGRVTTNGMVGKCVEAARWRYHVHIRPHVVVHRNPLRMATRFLVNHYARRVPGPVAFVYANPTNSGDYASHLGVRRLVGRRGVELFCDPVAVEATARALRAQPRRGVAWRGVFVGGGGLLQGCFDDFWRTLCELDLPIVLFGVGAAEEDMVRKPTNADLLRKIAGSARALHVRDEYTRRLFAEAGVDDVTLGVCPSVNYLDWIGSPLRREASHLLHVIHPVDLELAGVDLHDLRARLQACAAKLGLRYDETHHLVGMPRSLLRRYGRAAAVVSSRLHGCVFAFALKKPLLALACDRKTESFVRTHAPSTPLLFADDWRDRLTHDLVAGRMASDCASDLRSCVQVNERRMADILRGLDGLRDENCVRTPHVGGTAAHV